MIAAAVLDTVAAILVRVWSPPAQPAPLVEFVTGYRWTEGLSVKNGEGAFIDPRTHPAHYLALQAIGDGLTGRSRYRHFTFLKPTQDGGTWITVTLPLLYCVTQLGQPAVGGFPDMRLAGIAWRQKLRAPLIKAGHADWLPADGPGSEGNSTPIEVALRSVPLYFIGGGASNEAGQASLTGMLLTRDERDSMNPDVAALMSGRLDGFDDRGVIIDTSTVKAETEDDSQILQEISTSTAFRLAWPCPRCAGYQLWDWDRMVCDSTSQISAMRTVRLTCAHEDCAHPITDAERAAALTIERVRPVGKGQTLQRDGTVTGDLPETLNWGLIWTALDSPIKSLATLVAEYWAAEQALKIGDHAKMRKFYRDRLCLVYKGAAALGAAIDATALALRSARATYPKRQVPPGTTHLTVAGDVQKRELWWMVMAHGSGGRWWIIDYGRQVVTGDFRAEPSEEEVHDAVAVQVAIGWTDADGDSHLPLMKGWDSRYQSQIVKNWLSMQGGSWLALRGSGEGQHSDKPSGKRLERIEGWIDVREISDGTIIYYAEATILKDVLQAGLSREPGVGGAGHIPHGEAADGWLIKQLTAEKKVDGVWLKVKRDNHFMDCAVYNLALGKLAAAQPSTQEQLPVWGKR